MTRRIAVWGALVLVVAGSPARGKQLPPAGDLVGEFCLDCHDADSTKGDLDLEALLDAELGDHSDPWEKVVRQLRARQMPPIGKDRPDHDGYEGEAAAALEEMLDARAAQAPQPGRVAGLRRLTRFEYQNAIRDLLGLQIDAGDYLPADTPSHGFDNVDVGELSPTLLDRYLTAAEKLSRLALGNTGSGPAARTIRIRADITQEGQVEGLPPGTRGGALIAHTFPRSGEYELRVVLARDRNEHVEGLRRPHQMEVLVDGEPAADFEIRPPDKGKGHGEVDRHLVVRLPVTAGQHQIGVTFARESGALEETLRQPYEAHFNTHRHPRLSPAVFQINIEGPLGEGGGAADSPIRERILGGAPEVEDDDDRAQVLLGGLMRRAYRRPVAEEEVDRVMALYESGAAEAGGFEAGMESALAGVLVSPDFLFRRERDPEGLGPGEVYEVAPLELASRLSFFLWGSLPDEGLLGLAESGRLADPAVLDGEVDRMLADPRADALVHSFADQWLYLRNLDEVTPDGRLFPDFDHNLRESMRRETELLFETVMREDRPVLDLLDPGFTFLDERLARHYGIPHIYGNRFRRIELLPESKRGGILRQASVLTVTSYATRTSPVLRAHWVLENLLGTPPPPPPPNTPALDDNTVDASLPQRERLAAHREDPACASCHNLMDPVGFALENFDPVGRWREMEGDYPIDASGGLPDGSEFVGPDGLEAGLLKRPEAFVRTMAEKLLTYALGRGIEPSDAPAVRQIVRATAAEDYRFSALVRHIVESPPFRMREAE